MFVIESSTTPMSRNALMGETTYAGFARGLDWGLDLGTQRWWRRKSVGAFAARLTRFVAVDVPVAQYLFAWTHEYGHKTRVNEAGLAAHVVVGGSPWSLTAFTDVALTGAEVTPAMYSAGMEATAVIADRVERRMVNVGAAHYTDLTALFIANAMAFGYLQHDLSAGRVRRGFTLEGPDYADPSGYVVTVLSRRLGRDPTMAERQDMANDVRRASWLNFVDYDLVNVGAGLFRDYLWRGQRQTPIRWIRTGSIYVIPSLRYALTPVGPERQVRSFVKAGAATLLAYARWSERVDNGRLVGVGVDYTWRPRGQWRPSFALDLWRNPDGTGAFRAEGGSEWAAPASRLVLMGAIGAKRRGYLLGFPEEAGVYLNAGVGIRF